MEGSSKTGSILGRTQTSLKPDRVISSKAQRDGQTWSYSTTIISNDLNYGKKSLLLMMMMIMMPLVAHLHDMSGLSRLNILGHEICRKNFWCLAGELLTIILPQQPACINQCPWINGAQWVFSPIVSLGNDSVSPTSSMAAAPLLIHVLKQLAGWPFSHLGTWWF
jgi:hypothetical protein